MPQQDVRSHRSLKCAIRHASAYLSRRNEFPTALEATEVQIIETSSLAEKTAKIVVSDRAVLGRAKTLVAKLIDKAVSRAMKSKVSANPPFQPPSRTDNLMFKVIKTVVTIAERSQ